MALIRVRIKNKETGEDSVRLIESNPGERAWDAVLRLIPGVGEGWLEAHGLAEQVNTENSAGGVNTENRDISPNWITPAVNTTDSGNSIETKGTAGRRATFGEFLTRSGIAPGRSFRRETAEGRQGRFDDAFALSQITDPASLGEDPESQFEDFLSRQSAQGGGGRQALRSALQQAMGLDASSLSLDDPLRGGLEGQQDNRTLLSNAATNFQRSRFSPLVNIRFRGAQDLESDFLQGQREGTEMGNFAEFLRNRLGLDRLGLNATVR